MVSPGIQADTLTDEVLRQVDCIEEGTFLGDYPGKMQFHHTITTGTGTTIEQDEPPTLFYIYNNLVYECGVDPGTGETLYACLVTVEESSEIVIGTESAVLTYKGVIIIAGDGSCGPGGFDFSGQLIDMVCDDDECTGHRIDADGSTLISLLP